MIGVGDLVVCVDAGDIPSLHTRAVRLDEGSVYKVAATMVRNWGGLQVPCVKLSGVDYPGYAVARFRKIQHDKREACESEFITLLNRVKQGERA